MLLLWQVSLAHITGGAGAGQAVQETSGKAALDAGPVGDNDFGVFPNPAAGVVTVETNDFWGEHLQLEIYNSLGQRLRLQPLTAVQTSLDLFGMRSEVLCLRSSDLDSGLRLTKRLVLVH